jgi:hypothetical protein
MEIFLLEINRRCVLCYIAKRYETDRKLILSSSRHCVYLLFWRYQLRMSYKDQKFAGSFKTRDTEFDSNALGYK